MARRTRTADRAAVAAVAPVIAVLPVAALALAVFWWPTHLIWDVSYRTATLAYVAGAVLLFVRPVQTRIVAPLLGARMPTRSERVRLETAWRPVTERLGLSPRRYVLAVLPSDELNAFACGGHLVVVTSFAVDTLPRDELSGVLAHELSHHLGLHTVGLALSQWLSMPVLLLARIGFYLQNVAAAATDSFAAHSSSLTALGRIASGALRAVSWIFLAGFVLTSWVSNSAGRDAEFRADERTVRMGFGPPLAMALRRVTGEFGSTPATTWRERLSTSHPSPRLRVARIEAMLRRQVPMGASTAPRTRTSTS